MTVSVDTTNRLVAALGNQKAANEVVDLINATSVLSAAEAAFLDSVVAGTIAASKAVVVDANKDAGDFRNVDAVNIDAGASGTAGSVDVFPATAAKGKLAITKANNTNNDTTTLSVALHGQATTVTIGDVGLATSYVVQSTAQITAAEADVLDGATAGTQVASKAVIADSNVNTGISKVTELHIGATGAETQVTTTPAVLNVVTAGVAAGYKIARGVSSITGTGTVVTGLATVVAVVAVAQSDLDGDALAGVSATIGDQAGTPAAGSVIIKAWKVTTGGAAGNPTLIAATDAKDINWVAIGT